MNDRLPQDLTALRDPAPATLLPNVLVATGVADGYLSVDGPIGPLFVAFNEHGVSAVDLAGSPGDFEAAFAARFGRQAVAVDTAPPEIAGSLDEAIRRGTPGRLAVDLRGVTPFQAEVLRKTAEIPRGEVRPYSWVAKEIGRPAAARAVGSAVARNPVPIVVPCHRVVRSDGVLGEYSLGHSSNKPRLLRSEGLDVDRFSGLAARDIRLIGSDTTRIYCHPTCQDARRITDAHLVEFRSESQAERMGYRPCKRCRPGMAA